MSPTASVALDAKVSARVVSMYESGERLIDITRATGVPRASIYWVLRKEGITPSRMPKPSGEMMSVHDVLDRLRTTERENGQLRERLAAAEAVNAELMTQLKDKFVQGRTTPARQARPKASNGDTPAAAKRAAKHA